MKEATYYVRVSVNGAPLEITAYCKNRPTGIPCSFKVRVRQSVLL